MNYFETAFPDILNPKAHSTGMTIGTKFWLNVAILFIFGVIYTFYLSSKPDEWATPLADGEQFNSSDKLVNGFYVAVIVHATIGFGDFYPKSAISRMIVMIHAILVFFINLVL